MQTLKRYYINVKFEKYGTYTFEARSKEHAIEMYNDGDYGWSDYSEDFGEFNEVIEDVEEEVFADTQLSLEGVLALLTIQNITMQFKHSLRMMNFIKYGTLSKSL